MTAFILYSFEFLILHLIFNILSYYLIINLYLFYLQAFDISLLILRKYWLNSVRICWKLLIIVILFLYFSQFNYHKKYIYNDWFGIIKDLIFWYESIIYLFMLEKKYLIVLIAVKINSIRALPWFFSSHILWNFMCILLDKWG